MKTAFRLILTMLLPLCLLASCNHNDEPVAETYMPILQQYLPLQEWIDETDTENFNECAALNDKLVVVNSKEEIPVDNRFHTHLYFQDIDFSTYTLLIVYDFTRWDIIGMRPYLIRNNLERSFGLTIKVLVGERNPRPGYRLFTQYSFLVNKIPSDKTVTAFIVPGADSSIWNDED